MQMRLRTPRITPLRDDEFPAEIAARTGDVVASPGGVLNVFRTLARVPDAFRAFNWWGGYVLARNSLSPRDREIIILRTGWLCRSGYEWTQHHRIGLRAGLSAWGIEQIKLGPGASNWTDAERSILMATDDLVRDHFISNNIWTELVKHYSERQCMDVVFTAGQHTQVSMMLNAFGVQLDPGQDLDPDFKRG